MEKDILIQLYGEDFSKELVKVFETLDPDFKKFAQEVAYGIFWKKEGLSIRDKSLVTISALVAQGKEWQTKIHIRGFLNNGGTEEELRNAFLQLAAYCGFPAAMNAFAALNEVVKIEKNYREKRFFIIT